MRPPACKAYVLSLDDDHACTNVANRSPAFTQVILSTRVATLIQPSDEWCWLDLDLALLSQSESGVHVSPCHFDGSMRVGTPPTPTQIKSTT
jgi:hypothetical protein